MQAHPLTGKARAAVTMSTASINAYEGSVRSSKTFTSLIDWVRYCRTGPDGLLLMTGKTERTIVNNLLHPLQELLGKHRVQINAGLGTATICGREVLVVGANNESARTKIQGLTLAGAYVDEASTLPESYFNMLYSRLSIAGAQMWLTSNPENPSHWLKVKWLDRAKVWLQRDGQVATNVDGIDLHRFTFILDDNPHLPADYVKRIKAAYVGLWYRRYINAEWVVAEGAVYDMWDPARHVVKAADIPRMERILSLGVDYGTTNPTRGELIGLAEGTLWVLDEWAPTRGTDAQLSADLRGWMGRREPAEWRDPRWLFVDPAAASFKLQLYQDGLSNVADGANQVLPGIRTIASLLGSDRMKVSDRCTHLIDQIPGYSWDPKATAKGEDAPIKRDDHEVDGLRYGVHTARPLWRNAIPILTPTDDLEEAA